MSNKSVLCAMRRRRFYDIDISTPPMMWEKGIKAAAAGFKVKGYGR